MASLGLPGSPIRRQHGLDGVLADACHPYSSDVQQPVRTMAVLGKRPYTRQAAPFDREQDRAGSLHQQGVSSTLIAVKCTHEHSGGMVHIEYFLGWRGNHSRDTQCHSHCVGDSDGWVSSATVVLPGAGYSTANVCARGHAQRA